MRVFMLTAAILFGATAAHAAEANDAWPLYKQAGERIREGDKLNKSSPSASNVDFAGYPPFPPEWHKMAKEAYEFNASAFEAVHRASAMPTASWPVEKVNGEVQLRYLSEVRNIANEVGDAAFYEHTLGNDAAAFGRVKDLWHIADLLDGAKDELMIQALVAVGIRAMALDRIQILSADLGGKVGGKPVATDELKALIKVLFVEKPDFTTKMAELQAHEAAFSAAQPLDAKQSARTLIQFQRSHMERNLTAMSLACRVFQMQNKRWPASLDEIKPLLPALPTDAWGPLGYVLVKGGRPDGGDRPMVFSRVNEGPEGKLSYPLQEPQFGWYASQDKNRTPPKGQFRDVSVWTPTPALKQGPSTQVLK